MAPSSSSTKKAARLAQKGQGRKIRFQGGTLFPAVVALVVVLGLGLVVYARASRPPVDASAPTVDDHWHHAYGFYLCDTWFKLSGTAEETDSLGLLVNTDFNRTGIHSHDDGVIHWHPWSSASTGGNAKLGVFLDTYGVGLTNTKLTFPEDQRAALPYQQETGVFENDETTCTVDGKEEAGQLKVVVWENFSDTGEGQVYIADFDNIALDQNSMVVAIAFVPAGTDVTMPPWSPDLPELGAVDSGQVNPNTTTTVVDGSLPTDTTPSDGTVVDATVPDTESTEAVTTTTGG